MKRIICTVLALTIALSCLFSFSVVMAEGSGSGVNWNIDRGIWDIKGDTLVCTGTSDRQWVYSSETVTAEDNWSFSTAVDTASGGQQFFFGRKQPRFNQQCSGLYVQVFPDGKFRLYYQITKDNGGTVKVETKQYGRTFSFPSGSKPLKYGFKIAKKDNMCGIYFDGVCVFEFDLTLPEFEYGGGHFAIFQPNSNKTTYSGVKLAIEKPAPEIPDEEIDERAEINWNVDRGIWEQNENAIICTGTSDRQWVYSDRTVKTDDNWSFGVDVKTVSGGQQFYFGRTQPRFNQQCNGIYVQLFADGKFRVFSQVVKENGDGTSKVETKQYGRTYSFPEGSSGLKYRFGITALGGRAYVFIDDICVFEFDLNAAELDYQGGYFAIFQGNNNVTTYSNYSLAVNNEPFTLAGGKIVLTADGFRSANSKEKWNTVWVGSQAEGDSGEIELDYKEYEGNRAGYVRFGYISDTNFYEVRLETPETDRRKFTLWHIGESNKKLAEAYLSASDRLKLGEFKIKVSVTDNNAKVYINGDEIISCGVDYYGGKFAVQALYTKARFSNIKTSSRVSEDTNVWKTVKTAWNTVSSGWSKVDGIYSIVNPVKWNTAIFDKKLNGGDFIFETEIMNFADNGAINFLIGLPGNSKNTNDAYSVRCALEKERGNENIAVYNDKENNKRYTGWMPFPADSDKHNFRVKIQKTGKLLKVFIDDKLILTTDCMANYTGGYIGFATLQAAASFRDTSISILEGDDISPESNLPLDEPEYNSSEVNWNIITPYWEECENGYKTTGTSRKDRTAILKPRLGEDEDFTLTADIENFTGENKHFQVLLGTSHAYVGDGFSIRNNFADDAVGKNMAFYEGRTRKTGWMTWPADSSNVNFKLRVEMRNKRLTVLVDDYIVVWTDVKEYKGGYLGFISLVNGLKIKNVKLYTENQKTLSDTALDSFNTDKKTPDFKSLSYAAEKIKKGMYLGCLVRWNKTMSEEPVSGDWQFDTDVVYVSGDVRSYNFVFGCKDNEDTDSGYFLVVSRDEATGKTTTHLRRGKGRVTAVFDVPESINAEDFHLTLRVVDGVCAVYMDSIPVFTSKLTEASDGYLGMTTKSSSALFINMSVAKRDAVKNVTEGVKPLIPQTGDDTPDITAVFITALVSGFVCILLAGCQKYKGRILK